MAARGVDLTTSGQCTFCNSFDWQAEWRCANGATVRVCLVCAVASLPKLIVDALPDNRPWDVREFITPLCGALTEALHRRAARSPEKDPAEQ